ncbi:MAG: N-acetylmuramoyl-L-alanine amidase [Bdellovibrionales bacterium]|nr:N-acetylmuramoyl-L-alanine amidase [Bdellovibrionales bacterium]
MAAGVQNWVVASAISAMTAITLAPASHAARSDHLADAHAAYRSGQKFLVVLDPGHGGNDKGATYKEGGKTYTEKELTLTLARDLARELIIRDFNVVLTRNDDHYVALSDRTALANKVKADVFISIHLNSSNEKMKSGGVETFILNHATDEGSKRLADLENSVLKDSSAKENTTTPDVSLIMKDLILDANLEPSRKLACAVHQKVREGTKDRGVKQALFYVLLGADMPSVLVELGFINASGDRERILNQKFRLKLAAQFTSALENYRAKKTPRGCVVQSELQFKRDIPSIQKR